MKKSGKKILSAMVLALAIVALATAPAMAKSSKNANKQPSSSATQGTSSVPDLPHKPTAAQGDSKPGPAWKTVGGTIKHIKGNTYTIEDYEGNQVQLYIGQGTKQIRGNKKVGDTVRAEITRGGFANSIQ